MNSTTLVVTDLDGTFWHGAEEVHPQTLSALKQLEAAGVPVLVATGRRLGSAQRGFVANGLALPAVLLNGALGFDFGTQTEFHRHTYPADAAAAVLAAFAHGGLSPCIYTDDGKVHAFEPSTGPAHRANLADDLVLLDSPGALPPDRTVLNFSILGRARHELEPVAEAIKAAGLGETACYGDELYGQWSIMVQPKGISKWQGIEAWIAHAGLTPDRVIAMGDGGNDIEMLQAADVALSVEGGDPKAHEHADHIIGRASAGGWAAVLDHI